MRRSWILIATAAATLLVVGYPLNGNLRYETGVHRVSGFSAADTFSHRPMLFRLISAGQAWLPTQASGLFGEPGSFERAWAFEAGYRLLGFIACAVAAALLARGLRRWLGSASWPYGLAAYAALRTGRVDALRAADAPWPARDAKQARDARIHALGGESRPR